MENKVAIGIDLGTTYSCVAAYVDGDVKIFTNNAGKRTMPSCVTILEDQRIIGEIAKENCLLNLKNTIFDAKRLIGRKYDDPQVQVDKQYLTYDIVECYDQLKIEIPWGKKKRTFYPEEISAMVLAEMKKIAESGLNQEVTDAVITVPAHFNNSQRQATIDAARIAGLNVLTIINEPTAAALAYNYETNIAKERNILVYDLGGGTFDVSIFSMKGSKITKKATGGDTHLGGEDFVTRMVEFLIEEFKKRHKIDVNTLSDKDRCNVLRRLHNRCEKAKKTLSSLPSIDISIDCLVKDVNFCHTIYQAQFETLNNDYFEKTIDIVNECLKESQLEKDDIDEIVLVGGSSRIPKVQSMLEDYFDNKKNLNKTLNPDEVVAYGAAIQAATYLEKKSKEICDLSLLDMTPLALGVGSKDGVMSVVVEKNTVIPTKKTKLYSTTMNNQSSMLIRIYEGERSMIEDNDFLGEFELINIPKAPRGVIKIKVTFDIDANSILTISAAETSKGMENNITIADNKGRLTHEDIDKLIQEAETFKLQDEKRKNQITCKNNLIRYCHDVMKLLNDSKKTHKITTEKKTDFLKKIAEVLDWAESHSFEEVAKYANKRLELENDYKALLQY